MTDPEEYYAKQPEFLGPTVVEIDVPSGRLITADTLCDVDRFDIDSPLSIESGVGLDAWAKAFAEVGVAYAFVGNISPTITRRVDGLIQVISPGWDSPKEIGSVVGDEAVVAEICTDLWAAMLTDYQGWLDHSGPDVDTANAPYGLKKFNVFDVTPGKYRWTVYSHSDRWDRDALGRITFAQLELVQAY